MEEQWSAFKILTCTLTGKRILGRSRRGWENNIRIDLKEIGISRRIELIRFRIRIMGEPL